VQGGGIGEGVAVDGEDVGVVAGGDPALAVPEAEDRGRGRGDGAQRLSRAEADVAQDGRGVADHVMRLDRGDAGVAAADHQRPGLVEARPVRQDARHPGPGFGEGSQSLRRNHADGEADDRAAVRDQLDQLGGGVHAVRGPERDVLQHVGPGRHRVGDRAGRVGMRGDLEAVPVRLVDRGPEHLGRELGEILAGARGEVPAAGHDLDDVDAALGVLAHRGPDRADGGFGDAAQVVAVAAGGGDRRPGRHDGGQPWLAAQAEGQVVAVAQVPDGGDAAAQRRPRGSDHRFRRLVIAALGQTADWVGAGVEGQVGVAVDQAGQQRGAAQVGDVRVVGSGYPGAHRDDGAAVDQDQRIGDQGVAGPVERSGGTECDEPAPFGPD